MQVRHAETAPAPPKAERPNIRSAEPGSVSSVIIIYNFVGGYKCHSVQGFFPGSITFTVHKIFSYKRIIRSGRHYIRRTDIAVPLFTFRPRNTFAGRHFKITYREACVMNGF